MRPWKRKLWGVEHWSTNDSERSVLLGAAWDSLRPAHYAGEASRALLFRTRREARAWCVNATSKHIKHSPDWRFRPVRVEETLTPIIPRQYFAIIGRGTGLRIGTCTSEGVDDALRESDTGSLEPISRAEYESLV